MVDTSLFLFGAAFLAGLFGAMLGLGGGIFLVPILSLVLGLPMHFAVGTSIVAVIATSATAASNYIRAGLTNVRLGLLLQISTAGGAIVGGVLATSLPDSILAGIFGIVMLFTSYSMYRSGKRKSKAGESANLGEEEPNGVIQSGTPWKELEATYYDQAHGETVKYQPVRVGTGMGACTAAGVLSGMLGIGGGPIQVPIMHLVMKVPLRAAAGTSNLMVGVTAVASAFVYYAKGFMVPSLAVPAVLGVSLGALLGAHISQRVSSRVLSLVLAVVLLYVSAQMIIRAFGIRLG